MKRYLVDSDFLIGVFRESDANHKEALETLERIGGGEVELWATNLVRQESATVISHRVGMGAARLFVINFDRDIQRQVGVDEKLEKDAWKIFLAQKKKKTSFVDCANMATFQKYKLDGFLAFDEFYPKELRLTYAGL